jgi:D-alanyl-D-alanine endopeptidase (penicillin-binding protein 7)
MRYLIFIGLLFSLVCQAAPVTAKSYIVSDLQGQIFQEFQADSPRPIASITKLMTVVVVLDAKLPLDEAVLLNFKLAGRYHTHLPRRLKTLTRGELIDLAMVKSDNFAAYHLCSSYPGGVDSCIQAMNAKAKILSMTSTVYTDPTGLDSTNVSTARDLVKLMIMARTYPEIVSSTKPKVDIQIKRRWWQFWNTNPLVRKGEDVVVSKTGYISSSGGCLVMLINTDYGQRIVALLGSRNTHTRIPEALQLVRTN